MDLRKTCLLALAAGLIPLSPAAAGSGHPEIDAMVSRHAAANGVPESLVHRVIVRESRYNARAMHAGNYGLMQIKHATAKGMGYAGTASGLLDPETNLKYAVAYLGNAYRVARGNAGRAVSLYAGGFYYAAKRQGMLASLKGPAKVTVVSQSGEPQASASRQPAAGGIPFSAFADASR